MKPLQSYVASHITQGLDVEPSHLSRVSKLVGPEVQYDECVPSPILAVATGMTDPCPPAPSLASLVCAIIGGGRGGVWWVFISLG